MSSVAERNSRRASRPTLQSLHREIVEFRRRIQDLEDLRELNQAIERNGTKQLVPWTKAKKDLGLD